MRNGHPWNRLLQAELAFLWVALTLASTGCWAPIHSPGIAASTLPEAYRMPCRAAAPALNFATLTIPPQSDYILGPGDILDVTVHGLYPGGEVRPARAQVMASGEVWLPLVGPIRVSGMNILQAHKAITQAYTDGYIKDPRINIYLAEKATIPVLVLGEVNQPGIYPLPKYENDVGHAIAAAGGLRTDARGAMPSEIEVHRRVDYIEGPEAALPAGAPRPPEPTKAPQQKAAEGASDGGSVPTPAWDAATNNLMPVRMITIPLRGCAPEPVAQEDIILNPGDVVMVPPREDEVFYVVGRLSPSQFVRFSVGLRDREIGGGFLLPPERDIDVVTAVAMAGYIDPIQSPTTVTIHRTGPDGMPMLIRVDLIKARYDRRENIMIEAGDIVYLNPDAWWWFRTNFDRIVPEVFTIPYARVWAKN